LGLTEHFPHLRVSADVCSRFFWLSFEEFDYLVRAAAQMQTSVGRVLARYRFELEQEADIVETPPSIAPNISEWVIRRYAHMQEDPWLDEAALDAWDDCARELFGQGVRPSPAK
jgi:hypothetical protein